MRPSLVVKSMAPDAGGSVVSPDAEVWVGYGVGSGLFPSSLKAMAATMITTTAMSAQNHHFLVTGLGFAGGGRSFAGMGRAAAVGRARAGTDKDWRQEAVAEAMSWRKHKVRHGAMGSGGQGASSSPSRSMVAAEVAEVTCV
jgi:hypothetical protein